MFVIWIFVATLCPIILSNFTLCCSLNCFPCAWGRLHRQSSHASFCQLERQIAVHSLALYKARSKRHKPHIPTGLPARRSSFVFPRQLCLPTSHYCAPPPTSRHRSLRLVLQLRGRTSWPSRKQFWTRRRSWDVLVFGSRVIQRSYPKIDYEDKSTL